MAGCNNYKVRINACSALCVPRHRSVYGSALNFSSVFHSACRCLFDLSATSDTEAAANDFTNYRYTGSLREGLTALIVHLVSLLEASDLSHLSPHELLPISFSDTDHAAITAARLRTAKLRHSITSESSETRALSELEKMLGRITGQLEGGSLCYRQIIYLLIPYWKKINEDFSLRFGHFAYIELLDNCD